MEESKTLWVRDVIREAADHIGQATTEKVQLAFGPESVAHRLAFDELADRETFYETALAVFQGEEFEILVSGGCEDGDDDDDIKWTVNVGSKVRVIVENDIEMLCELMEILGGCSYYPALDVHPDGTWTVMFTRFYIETQDSDFEWDRLMRVFLMVRDVRRELAEFSQE